MPPCGIIRVLMPFFELSNDDKEPGPAPRLSREERWAAQLESTPRQQLVGRVGEMTNRVLAIKTRYLAIAALAAAGGSIVYINHVVAENPAPVPIEHLFDRPDPCVTNLPNGLAAEDPTLAMAKVQECHERDMFGGVLQPNSANDSGQQN